MGEGLWHLGEELWQVGEGLWHLGEGLWQVGERLWHLGEELWQVGEELWHLGEGLWQVGEGLWHLGEELWQVEISFPEVRKTASVRMDPEFGWSKTRLVGSQERSLGVWGRSDAGTVVIHAVIG